MAQLYGKNLRIFGAPYQFTKETDPRYNELSETIGRKYLENILMEAPIITVIPGKPKYLPTDGNLKTTRDVTSSAFIQGAIGGSFDNLKTIIKEGKGDFKYYDFQRDYTTYMQYVNVLCHAASIFLDLENEEMDGVKFSSYDWRSYRSTSSAYKDSKVNSKDIFKALATGKNETEDKNKSSQKTTTGTSTNGGVTQTGSSVFTDNVLTQNAAANTPTPGITGNNNTSTNTTTTTDSNGNIISRAVDAIGNAADGIVKFVDNAISFGSDMLDTALIKYEESMKQYNYVQFYVDTDASNGESISNASKESMMIGMFDGGSELFKEVAFIANSAGVGNLGGKLTEFTDGLAQGASSMLSGGSGTVGSLTGAFGRILSVGGNVVKGENVVIPDIYQSSSVERGHSFTVHLKALYGNKLSYYLDVLVPLMHLLALSLPRQTTANTYGAPFLVKAYLPGVLTCNLGLVTGLAINKSVNPESWTVDGLPNEIDVTVTIADLYSDLSLSPQNEPSLFLANSSLVEYIAINCSLDLINSNLTTKANLAFNTYKSSITSIPDTIVSKLKETADNILSGIRTY